MSRSIAHYELLERVAEGGMGVIYKARDTDLDRLVALKFLPNDADDVEDAFKAFLYEARAISRLNHPNIATIYAVEEVNGERFLALEFLSGGTLRDRVKESPDGLPLDEILRLATPIARALAHSHRHGIIHRDVKSENVLLTEEGEAKLTDFGVAQVRDAALSSGAAATAGTAAYMSPEQAQGLETDHRSDIFSFGAMLYEMADGKPPFWDEQETVILYDIVNTPAPPLERSDLPEEFTALLERLLEKEPDKRIQSMEEVVEALAALNNDVQRERTGERGPVEQKEPAIAVLPFLDMSPDGDQEYFCDGITEEITLALSSVKGLRVVSRTSTFQFKGQAYDIRKIGQRLKVATVLEGSVRKAGNTIRISVQLVNVADGYHVWSQRYDRPLEDVFAVQEEIADAIVRALRVRLAAPEQGQARKRPTDCLEAYNEYLSGRYLLNQRTRPALTQALERFDGAIEKDPQLGLAWGAKAETLVLIAARSYTDDIRGTFEQAREAARKATELDPDRAEPFVALALVLLRADWDWTGAREAFKRAIDLNPGYAPAHHQYAMFLAMTLDLEEARREIQRAHELDPLSLLISTASGRILHFSRRYEDAVEQCSRTREMDPTFVPALFDTLVSLAMLGRAKEAYDAIQRINELTVEPKLHCTLMAYYYGLAGEKERAVAERERLVEIAKEQHIQPGVFALIDIGIDEIESAMRELERGAEDHDDMLVYLQCEPMYDAVRDHPRYPELVKRVGFPSVGDSSA